LKVSGVTVLNTALNRKTLRKKLMSCMSFGMVKTLIVILRWEMDRRTFNVHFMEPGKWEILQKSRNMLGLSFGLLSKGTSH